MVGPDQDPIRRAITEEFFRIVDEKSDEYELFISPVAIEELQAGVEKYGEDSVLFINSLECTELPENDKAENLVSVYTTDGVLSRAHLNDLRHIAYAVVFECDYVITWNMKHLANERTVSRVNVVNQCGGYEKIFISTPDFFTGGKIHGQ